VADLHDFPDFLINVIFGYYSFLHFGSVMLFDELKFIDYRKYFCELIGSDLLQILEVLLVDFSVVKV
jgi:hypothetical protein